MIEQQTGCYPVDWQVFSISTLDVCWNLAFFDCYCSCCCDCDFCFVWNSGVSFLFAYSFCFSFIWRSYGWLKWQYEQKFSCQTNQRLINIWRGYERCSKRQNLFILVNRLPWQIDLLWERKDRRESDKSITRKVNLNSSLTIFAIGLPSQARLFYL